MKKLLSILAAVGLTATAGATVVACGGDKPAKDETIKFTHDNVKDIIGPWGLVYGKVGDIQKKIAEKFASDAIDYKNADGVDVIGFKLKKDLKLTVGKEEITQKTGTHLNVSAYIVKDKVKEPDSWDSAKKAQDVSELKSKGGKFTVYFKVYSIDKDAKEWKDKTPPPPDNEAKVTDFASAPVLAVKINVDAHQKVAITLDKADAKMAANEGTAQIKITNTDIADLGTIAVTSADTKLASAVVDQKTGAIIITGHVKGETTISVTAEYGNEAKINVTIGDVELVEIAVDTKETTVTIGEKGEVKVTNYQRLGSIELVIANKEILAAEFTKGVISITGKVAGYTTIKIIAEHAATPKSITVKIVAKKVDITIQTEEVEVQFGTKIATLQITNEDIAGLGKITIAHKEGTEFATATPDAEGLITINIDTEKAVSGSSEVLTITAENGNATKDFTVKIVAKKVDITIQTEEVEVQFGTKIATLQITNEDIAGLGKITIAHKEGTEFATATPDAEGLITINIDTEKAVSGSSEVLTITAENGNATKDFTVNIVPKKWDIAIEKEKVDVQLGAEKATLQITNEDIAALGKITIAYKSGTENLATATADAEGLITIVISKEIAVVGSSVVLTITAENGNATKDFTVNIVPKKWDIAIEKEKVDVQLGAEKATLQITNEDIAALGKITIAYKSGTENLATATADAEGLITIVISKEIAVVGSSVVLTITAENGNATKDFTVNIVKEEN